MSLLSFVKSVYNYFVPNGTQNPEVKNDKSTPTPTETTPSGEGYVDDDYSDELKTEIAIKRNERKKAKHDKMKKHARRQRT